MASKSKALWKVEWVDPQTLKAHPDNYNRHPEDQLQVLDATIAQFGVYSPIIVSADGYILCHEGVTTAALRTAQAQVPIRRMDFAHDTPEARALMVGDNETRRKALPDADQLSQLLISLQADDMLQVTGHDAESLTLLYEQVAAQAPLTGFVPEEDPGPGEPPAEPVTRLGDVWCMGEHRIICGDCREAHLWEALLGKRKVRLVWTDPPYGIDMAPASVARDLPKLDNDNLGGAEFEAFLLDSLAMAASRLDGTEAYVCCDWRKYDVFKTALAKVGWPVKCLIVWNKETRAQNLNRFAFVHEFICYAGPMGPPTLDTNVWNCSREYSDEHLTPKPVELVAKAIGYSSKRGETVADPFLGSGTILIACDQLGRKCVGIELSPGYCDVICQRYTRMFNKPATLEATNQTFAELSAQRDSSLGRK